MKQSNPSWCATCESWRHTQPCGRDECPAASLSPRAEEPEDKTQLRLTNPAKRGPYGTYYFVCCDPFLAVRNGAACPSCGKTGEPAEEPGALVRQKIGIAMDVLRMFVAVKVQPQLGGGVDMLAVIDAHEADVLASLHEQIDSTSPKP